MAGLIIAAALILAALASYAGWLHYRLWRQKNVAQQTQVETFSPHQPHNQTVEVRKSIYLIADATLADKMTHTEACLRICALANQLDNSEQFRQTHSALFQVAEAAAHFPILDAWKALDKSEKNRLSQQRLAIEQKHQQAVLAALANITAAGH